MAGPEDRVEQAQSLLLPADEADFHACRVTPLVGNARFDSAQAHLPMVEVRPGGG